MTSHIDATHKYPYPTRLMSIDIGGTDTRLAYQPVEYNGFRFWFYTIQKENGLQNLQLSLIEAELLQAVGRARISREPATVTVVSNLPLAGAEFRYDNTIASGAADQDEDIGEDPDDVESNETQLHRIDWEEVASNSPLPSVTSNSTYTSNIGARQWLDS